MILIYSLIGIYVGVAAFCTAMTLREQSNTKDITLSDRVLAVLACFFWPLSFLAVAVAVQRRMAAQPSKTS